MPTWSGILDELNQSKARPDSPPQFDAVRRKYLVELSRYTSRSVILYATRFTQPAANIPPEALSIVDEDIQGIMEVIHGLNDTNLDLILHSPGGNLESAEAIVSYLRSKFFNIRVIVPQLAMSAATMIACAADRIIMGKHSFLGPTDPQFIVATPLGVRMIAAQAVLEQFQQAQKECQDPQKLAGWLPMLSQYGPDLLIRCQNASKMSETLVKEWLASYMFRYGDKQKRKQKSAKIARWLSNHGHFKSHARHISRQQLKAKGLAIDDLENDQKLQDLVLSVFHATTHTFSATASAKIIENHLGKAFIKHFSPPVPRQPTGVNPGR